ncbi:hypothetical protein GC170_20785 [bacterium]|nr:hypothetical protein [bacterium]
MKSEITDRRRFQVIDAMMLVAATAPGLILLRVADNSKLFTFDPRTGRGMQFLEFMAVAGGCVLVPMAFAVLVAGLCDRRTTRSEVVQGTGFISCLAVVVAANYAFAWFLVKLATVSELDLDLEKAIQFNNFFGRVKFLAGPMILGAWLALAMTGRLRSPTWIDRLGVFIGLGFVLLYLMHELFHFVQPLLSLVR